MSCHCDLGRMRGKACHCRACCLTFTGPWAFDRHAALSGHRQPEDIGLVEVRPGVWGLPHSDRAPRRAAS